MAEPEQNQGAMMTSLLVDGRPIHGDPGLPEVMKVFGDLRRHPGTMRLLLSASLSARAKSRSLRDLLGRRDTINLKKHALLPIVNTARWAALAVGSSALSTTERLQAAAGSAMLPDEQAHNLIDVFTVLQRLRLRYQLIQHQRGEKPADVISGTGCRRSTAAWSPRPSGRSPPSSGAWTTSPPTCPPRTGRHPPWTDRQLGVAAAARASGSESLPV